MKLRLWIAAAGLGLSAMAQNAPIRVLASRGMQAVIEDLQAQAEHEAGRKAAIQYSSSTDLKARIAVGEGFDVAIVTTDLMDELIKSGTVVAGTRVDVARAGIGVGIRAGAPKPDIKTSDAMKQTLLRAKAVTYAQDGASRVGVERMFDRMGIKAEMAKKLMLEQGSPKATGLVADGKAEIVLTLQSEILPVKGIELVGPLPAEHQNYIGFSAAAAAKAGDAAAAKKFVQFFSKAEVLAVLKAKGMEPVGKAAGH